VIDTVSLFHPALRVKLERSEFSSNERASLVFVPPVDPHQIPLCLMIESHIKKYLPWAFERFETHLDALCELNAADIRQFRRWLFSTMPELAVQVQGQRASMEQRRAMREQIGTPTGIDRKIFGWGPR
jgi:hypothetical protein